MTLLYGRDEPLGRVDLALDELHRLAVLLRNGTVRRNHLTHHIDITPVDLHLGDVARIERQVELPVVIVQFEVGNDIWRGIHTALGIEVSGFGREVAYLLYGLAELILADIETRHQLLVVFLYELVEIGCQDLARQTLRRRIHTPLIHLQQQTLAQVARADARRLQLVDYAQQTLQLVDRSLDTEREGYVIGYGLQIAAEISVAVDTADKERGDAHVPIRQVAITQLLGQVLLHRTPLRYVHRALLLILRVVVHTALVAGRIVTADIIVDRDLLLLLLGRGVLLQNDIVLDLLLYALFELHGRKLQQLDHLYLLRRECLLQFLNLTLRNTHCKKN